MPAKKLTDAQKELVRVNYINKRMNQKEMAHALDVSPRTINRVLNELGCLTTIPRMQREAREAYKVMCNFELSLGELASACAQYRVGPTRSQIIAEAVRMEEGTWAALLNDIITARVAANYNTHVQTSMLNLQKKVEANLKADKKD